ncbi:MAG: hypothetical protein M1838_003816 [Thelocarpon superellum]|nr:MAG: hypothetical protein M1838_003816 [Thelocarpon superellum]
MPSEPTPPPSPSTSSYRRRASFSPGQTFSGIFNRSPSSTTATSPFPGSIATAAVNAQNRRRMSITTLGLSGSSSTQTSPFGSATSRRESISSAGSPGSALDENVIEEGDGAAPSVAPNAAFARRMSFGARALRDVRTGGPNGVNGEGFSWTESLRSRAERTSTAGPSTAHASTPSTGPAVHQRAQSIATAPPPVEEIPKAAARVPDPFQERILKGDFYMD